MEEKNTQVKSQPSRRLSPLRVGLAVVVLLGITYSSSVSFAQWQENSFSSDYKPWFAAYVDVTSTPTYSFEQRGTEGASDAILSFIVSSHVESCTPTWGGYFTMNEAAVSLDLDRRIARLQQQGGRIAVSFGGAANSELALLCTNEEALFTAYKSVIERYNINTIDLDLENAGLTNTVAAKRRATVIARLQDHYEAEKKHLAVWLTLPVAPHGLTKEGTDAVTQMLASGVDLAGVNLMTMDYGGSKAEGDSMFEASKKALSEAHRQLGIIYELAGINLSSKSIWQKIGATPMIGQNDVINEVFSLGDADALNQFARANGVGRMSMWSANRDIPCGENYVDVKVVSDVCSGVTSSPFSFVQTLKTGFGGDLMQNANMITVEDKKANVHIVDDPEASPYQIWQATGMYLKGTKVAWHGNVYEAKWWSKNELPDNPVLQAWETPWQLIGPVLKGEKPIQPPTLPKGTYPEWSGKAVYDRSDYVLFEGTPYQAKWWNQGQSPAAAAANSDSSPWVPFTEKQIIDFLEPKVIEKSKKITAAPLAESSTVVEFSENKPKQAEQKNELNQTSQADQANESAEVGNGDVQIEQTKQTEQTEMNQTTEPEKPSLIKRILNFLFGWMD